MDKKIGFSLEENHLVIMETMRRMLSDFQQNLLVEIRLIVNEKKRSNEKEWIKSSDVKKLLGISHGTLQTLRNKGLIPFTKIGGVIYYSREELYKVFRQNLSLSDKK